jgi:hypothetical protein
MSVAEAIIFFKNILMNTIFYVCTYGGSGSTAFCKHLGQFAKKVYHVHSKMPPATLKQVNLFNEHFTEVDADPKNTKCIFLYRDPTEAILSRFELKKHLRNIECDENITVAQVAEQKKDLYGITEFFYNYLEAPRNYPVLFVKYEALFTSMDLVHQYLSVPPTLRLEPLVKVETLKESAYEPRLKEIYAPLVAQMQKLPRVFWSGAN